MLSSGSAVHLHHTFKTTREPCLSALRAAPMGAVDHTCGAQIGCTKAGTLGVQLGKLGTDLQRFNQCDKWQTCQHKLPFVWNCFSSTVLVPVPAYQNQFPDPVPVHPCKFQCTYTRCMQHKDCLLPACPYIHAARQLATKPQLRGGCTALVCLSQQLLVLKQLSPVKSVLIKTSS